MEYASGGVLVDWNDEEHIYSISDCRSEKQFKEEELKIIFIDIVKAVHYLHSLDIVHRDIKPQNILKGKGDFGVSILIENGLDILKSNEGTMPFKSPELVDASKAKNGYSGKMLDMWGLGVTFFAFAFMKLPFFSNNIHTLIHDIKNGEILFPEESKQYSPELIKFLNNLLNRNIVERPTIDELVSNEWLDSEGKSRLKDQLLKKILFRKRRTKEDIIISKADITNALAEVKRTTSNPRLSKKNIKKKKDRYK